MQTGRIKAKVLKLAFFVLVSFLFLIAGTFVYAQNPVTNTVQIGPAKAKRAEPKIGEEVYPPGTTGGPMVFIPAGEFMMGCNSAVDDKCRDDDKPYHKVYLDAYYIDKYELTVAEYMKCVKDGKCSAPRSKRDNQYCNWGYLDRGNHPLNCVDFGQAWEYCEWVGKVLPTEAEWEKAARGRDGRKYSWGNQEATCEYAVMRENVRGCGRDSTWPVGSKPKGVSPYGVMDMAGNVQEWVQDLHGEAVGYKSSPLANPKGTSFYILRGGSWSDTSYSLRSAYRYWGYPVEADLYYFYNGFRCARDAD